MASMKVEEPGRTERDASAGRYIVVGAVAPWSGINRRGGLVRALARSMPSRERRLGTARRVVGKAFIDPEGRFEITCDLAGVDRQADSGATHPDTGRPGGIHLSLEVIDGLDREVPIVAVRALGRKFGRSEILCNVPRRLEVAIDVDASDLDTLSEHELLRATVACKIADVSLEEMTDDDILFLCNELELDREQRSRLQWLRNSVLLARQSQVPEEAVYAWGRGDLPQPLQELASTHPKDLATILDLLLQAGREERRQVLHKACEQHIIATVWRDRIDEIERRLLSARPIQRHGTGKLVDAGNGAPLINLTIEIVSPDTNDVDAEPLSAVSDARGLFPLLYRPRGASAVTPPRRLHLRVRKERAGEPLTEADVELHKEPGVIEVRVPVPADREPQSHTLSRITRVAGIDLPSRLHSFLESAGIKTLADIRRNGGIAALRDLPVAADHEVVRRLEAHADLARVSSDTRANNLLIEKGYDCVSGIASATRADFVRKTHEALGDFTAAKIHLVAAAQTHFLSGIVSGYVADQANNYTFLDESAPRGVSLPKRCSCRECETAVSPLAYLVDLASYTMKHVSAAGAPITLQTLTQNFHQPFADLAVNCESVDARVRQVRLCVEVLRGYIGDRPLADPLKESALKEAEQAYQFAAYQALLSRIGTSYAELRLAQNADFATRQSVADRLQISIGKLSDLHLDPAANPALLTEARLEQLFGLIDTTRNPLAAGPLPQLRTWRLEKLRAIWAAQDSPPDVYDDDGGTAPLVQVPAGVVFAPPALAAKIAHDAPGQQLTFVGVMSFEERGTLLALSADESLRTAIRQLYHACRRLPMIDPDIVGPDDLREPSPGNVPFDLWKQRREWVDARLAALSAMVKPSAPGSTEQVPDLDAMLQSLYSPFTYGPATVAAWPATIPLADLANLTEKLAGSDFKLARFSIEDELNLSVESFGYLMRVRAKDHAWWADQRSERVSAEEWEDLRSILVEAIKARFHLTWREEESGAGIELGPRSFWASLSPPAEGHWPPTANVGVPLIDPDLVDPNELPDPLVGKRAIDLREARRARLADVRRELQAMREGSGFDAMVRWALGHPGENNPLQHDLSILRNELNDSDETVVAEATRKITDDLHLSVEAFRRLLVIKSKSDDPNPAKKPTPAEWDEVYDLLVPARQIKQEYPLWIQEEQSPVTGVVYWTALKAGLPRWRSSPEARARWQAALRSRNRAATIDPDVIGLGDLRDPVPGNSAFDLHQQRTAGLANQLSQLQAESKDLAGFDSRLHKVLGITWADLLEAAARYDHGHTISGRLEQLSLDFSGFNTLVRVGKLVASGLTVLDAEWSDINDILIQVWKLRNAATFLREEKSSGVTLGPDLFQIISSSGLPTTSLNAWRAPRSTRQDWLDRLQARIDQQATVVDALNSAVNAAEEATLVSLRDALIWASDAPGSSTDAGIRFEQQAKWITQNLLIDAKMSGCTMTTRIAQAIELVQGLVHALRTAQPEDLFSTWVLDLTNFDEEWKWMGSYPSWRGAMFAWLYCELLLQPGLKRAERQTPALKALLNNTRGNRTFTPEAACLEARRYAEYFEDVATLSVQATCIARTRMHSGGCNKSVTQERCLYYTFGIGGATGKAYWSRYDFQSGAGFAQTFWEPIASPKAVPEFHHIVEILGAVPFRVSSGRRLIFLLAKKLEANQTSLVCAKFDLDNDAWSREESFLTLTHPMGTADFTGVVCQSDSESHPPHVLFYGAVMDHTRFREQRLNEEGTGWAEDGTFRPLHLGMEYPATSPATPETKMEYRERYAPVSMVCYRDGFVVFAQGPRWVSAYKCFPNPDQSQPHRYIAVQADLEYNGGTPARFRGAFTWNGIDAVFLYASRSAAGGGGGTLAQTLAVEEDEILVLVDSVSPSPYTQNVLLAPIRLQSPFPADGWAQVLLKVGPTRRRGLAPTWGITDYDGGKTKQFVYSSQLRTEHHRPVLIRDPGNAAWLSHFVANSSGTPLTPNISGPFDISVGLSDAELIARRDLQLAAAASIQSYPACLHTYLEEAFYSVRIALALALQRSGEFIAALDWFRTVYADGVQPALRKIHPGLVAEESLSGSYTRAADWLLDALDPHAIAATRRDAYTRYTLLAIVDCLLDYADEEFTRDTAESNPIARRLYLRALELLDSPELQQRWSDDCQEAIGILEGLPGGEWQVPMLTLQGELNAVEELNVRKQIQGDIGAIMQGDQPAAEKFKQARERIARARVAKVSTFAEILEQKDSLWSSVQIAAASSPHVSRALDAVGQLAEEDFQRSMSIVTGLSPVQLLKKSTSLAWLRRPSVQEATDLKVAHDLTLRTRQDGVAIDALSRSYQGELARMAEVRPLGAWDITMKAYTGFVPTPILGFCVPPNPMLSTLRSRAQLNLYKLRTCRNIAGLKRALDPYAAPTDAQTGLPQIGAGGQIVLAGAGRSLPPTLYRYSTLIERAKQLVQLAAQIEATMLAAIQRRDEAAYNIFKARQELELADAGVQLQDLRVTESQSRIALATLGEARARFQVEHFEELITKPISESEQRSFDLLVEAADFLDSADDLQVIAAAIYFSDVALKVGGGLIGGLTGGSAAGPAGQSAGSFLGALKGAAEGLMGSGQSIASGLTAYAGGLSARAQIRSTRSSYHAMLASFERRMQEWQYQRDLAVQDVAIASQQIQIATDEANVVQQERVIARIQQTHARDTVEFLVTKQFGTPELYQWMSDVLEGVYRFFLQQATAVAHLALAQLAFTRQEVPPAFLRCDYWNLQENGGADGSGSSPDRRGLTGSARLLQDIYQLDQYAFDTRKRKLPLIKILSLAKLAPIEFQQLRETGVITFATPMELFDRDFPGHYLRLISRISVSVVALIPPVQGIHATLTSSGLSRVVIGPDVFQRVTVRRDPEVIALSSLLNATGVVELEPQDEVLRPFEGTGVDTMWEFRMPRASNQFDYRTLADVLVTIEYTALSSADYRDQVIQSLPATLQSQASFSFTRQFADQWFDFHNPEQTRTPMAVTFRTVREDFPPNLDSLRITHVSLYCSRIDGERRELPVKLLKFTEAGGIGGVGSGATTVEGLISTRLGSGAGWNAMIGKSPFGEWELALPNTQEIREMFKSGAIHDLLLVIAFSGRAPEWPA